jgi:hypothetical protein
MKKPMASKREEPPEQLGRSSAGTIRKFKCLRAFTEAAAGCLLNARTPSI